MVGVLIDSLAFLMHLLLCKPWGADHMLCVVCTGKGEAKEFHV